MPSPSGPNPSKRRFPIWLAAGLGTLGGSLLTVAAIAILLLTNAAVLGFVNIQIAGMRERRHVRRQVRHWRHVLVERGSHSGCVQLAAAYYIGCHHLVDVGWLGCTGYAGVYIRSTVNSYVLFAVSLGAPLHTYVRPGCCRLPQ